MASSFYHDASYQFDFGFIQFCQVLSTDIAWGLFDVVLGEKTVKCMYIVNITTFSLWLHEWKKKLNLNSLMGYRQLLMQGEYFLLLIMNIALIS